MKPIPLRLLVHSVVYNEYLGNTGEKVSYGANTTLNNVRVEEQKKYSKVADRVEVIGSALLFYDCVYSSGLSSQPKPESKITYNGKQYTVVDVDILVDTKPHHYEVLLR